MSVRLQLFENRIKISAFGLPLRFFCAAAFLLCGGVPFARQLALAGFRSAQASPPRCPSRTAAFLCIPLLPMKTGETSFRPFSAALCRAIFLPHHIYGAPCFFDLTHSRVDSCLFFSFNRFCFPFRFRLRRQPHPRQQSKHRPRRSRAFVRSPLPLAQNFPRQAQCPCFPRSFCCGSPR